MGSVSDELDWTDVALPSCEPRVRAWLDHFRARRQAVLPLLDGDEGGLARALKGCEWSVVSRTEWLSHGFLNALVDELATSELLWSLARVPHLVTDPGLQEVIDRSNALAHLLSGIWELRFRVQDEQAQQGLDLNLPEHAHGALVRWLHGGELNDADRAWLGKAKIEDELAPSERLDAALCLTAMAQSSGVLGPTLVAFDDVGSVTGRATVERRQLVGELELLLESVPRWLEHGAHLGLILMMSDGPGRFKTLKDSSKRLRKSLNSLSAD